jgi:hypothetical protein
MCDRYLGPHNSVIYGLLGLTWITISCLVNHRAFSNPPMDVKI